MIDQLLQIDEQTPFSSSTGSVCAIRALSAGGAANEKSYVIGTYRSLVYGKLESQGHEELADTPIMSDADPHPNQHAGPPR